MSFVMVSPQHALERTLSRLLSYTLIAIVTIDNKEHIYQTAMVQRFGLSYEHYSTWRKKLIPSRRMLQAESNKKHLLAIKRF